MRNDELKLPQTSRVTEGSPSITSNDVTAEMQGNASDLVTINLTNADAMLAVITGAHHEGFAALDDELQSHYLWALNDLIQDASRARKIEVAGRAQGRQS